MEKRAGSWKTTLRMYLWGREGKKGKMAKQECVSVMCFGLCRPRGGRGLFPRLILAACAVCAAVSLTGCSTSRVVPYPYDVVSSVLKEKFGGKGDRFDHSDPDVSEDGDSLEISFESNVDFDYAVSMTLGAARMRGEKDKCSVSAKIREHLRNWEYQSRSERMEKLFLDCLERRLKTGEWGELPWEREELRSGMFSNLFK